MVYFELFQQENEIRTVLTLQTPQLCSRLRRTLACAVTFFLLAKACAFAQTDVLTQHNNNARTGANTTETVLTPDNVTRSRFGMLFRRALDDQPYTQPLLVTGLQVNGGTRDLVYVTTVNNSVYAFDANDAKAWEPVWHVNFGVPDDVNSADFGCLDMNGKMGIVGTPVIDKEHGVLYVVSQTKAGSQAVSAPGFTQRLHALDLTTGADLPRSPVIITTSGFDPLMENQRPALLLANSRVYVAYSSHCDKQPYHGFVFAYNAQTLHLDGAFNTTPTGTEASIWQSGQGPAADERGNIYVVAGNGTWDGQSNFSESFLKLSPDLHLLDWFTPTNHAVLDQHDQDLSSSGPTLIPGTNLILGGGKEGVLYTLDVNRLGHLGDEHAMQHFRATASHLHSLVFWRSAKAGRSLYVWGQRDRIKVYSLRGEHIDETPSVMRETPNEGHPGAMLSLSANGSRDGILWAAIHATGDSWHESRPGVLHAYNADDIRQELWNSLQEPQRDDCGEYSKMAPPTVANGRVYLPSFGNENTGTGQFCVYGLLPAKGAARLPPPTGLKTAVANRQVTLTWNAVTGASIYRVLRSSTLDQSLKVVAFGLTSPQYTDAVPARGEKVSYTVIAVGKNGDGNASQPVSSSEALVNHSMH